MDTLLVSYDVSDSDDHRLRDAIMRYPCAKLSDVSFAIKTGESAENIYEHLSRYVEDEDALYVIPLKGPWYGQGPHYVTRLFDNWL